MTTALAERVRRVEPKDPIATVAPHDYADAFAVDMPDSDGGPPEVWMKAGLTDVPPIVKRIVTLLGFSSDRGALGGWQVRSAGPEVLHLATSLPMMEVDLVGRNVTASGRTLTTVLHFTRPWLARLVWLVIAPAHRATVRRVITARG